MTTVTFADAVRAQLRLALRARSVYFLLALSALPWAFIVLIMKLAKAENSGHGGFSPYLLVSPVTAFYCLTLGAVWGLLAWRDEPPRARFYHWSLPVDMSTHELSRLAAYGLWLFVGMTAYIACGFAILIAYGVDFHLGVAGPWPWVGAYVSGLIGFFLTASISTSINRPIEYFAGAFIGIWSLALLATVYHFEALRTLLMNVFAAGSHYSLGSAVMSGGFAGSSAYLGPQIYESGTPPVSLPVIGPLALWLGISFACMIAATYVNRGRAS